MLELYKNIKQRRRELKMTQTELAHKTGYADKSMIAKIEKGDVDLSESKITKFAEALETTPGDLMGHIITGNDYLLINNDTEFLIETSKQGNSNILKERYFKYATGLSIPILNTVVAGMPIEAYEDILGYEEISHELASTGDFFALKVKGDSMSPVLQEGDILIVRQQPDVENGDIAIVLINGDTATVKKVQKKENGITLIAFNTSVYEPHFYTNDEIESLPVKIAGKVVEMKRSF